MSNLLQDRTIVVTGAATGIGQAFAQGCAAQGASVVVADMVPADETVAAIEKAGGKALYTKTDVSDASSCKAMAAAAMERFGRIDGLINNAAYFRELKLADFDTVDEAVFDRALAVNVKGVWLASAAVIPAMREAKAGSIVNIASVVGLRANPGQTNYAAAKAGLIAMTRNAAVEVARRGITINAVAPGWIDTEMTADVSRELLGQVPARRAGTPEEVAACVRFLASREAAYVTGAVLSVDGGLAA